MPKNWRPPPSWFKELDKLGKDDAMLTNREIADALGLGLDTVRKTLVRYKAEFMIEMDQNRPSKRYQVKALRLIAKKALADYQGK